MSFNVQKFNQIKCWHVFQLGCYVPAKSAQFRITDRMFSRMGFNDSIEKNLSTFMLEVKEV